MKRRVGDASVIRGRIVLQRGLICASRLGGLNVDGVDGGDDDVYANGEPRLEEGGEGLLLKGKV